MCIIYRFRNRLRAALLALLCLVHLPALALDPAIALEGYRHERWGELEGAPRYIDTLARSEDGWLWVGSRYGGLYRFDGLRFLPFAPQDGSRLQNNSISVLRPGRDGDLWIGHGNGGVSVLRQGRYQHLLTPEQSGSVFAISLDADGAVWVASWRGLFRIDHSGAAAVGAAVGFGGRRAEHVLADGAGRIWAADGVSLYQRAAGAQQFERVRALRGDAMLLEARDGSVWLVLGKQFERVAPPAPRRQPPPAGSASSFQSLFDRDANVWSGNCPVGVCVLRPGAWQGSERFTPVGAAERLDQPWQMTSLSVTALMEDGDGSIWIGTPSGLERLRDHAVHMVPELLDRGITHAAPHPDGGIIAVRTQRLDDTASLVRIEDGRLTAVPDPLATRVLDQAPDGTLVLAGQHGIERRGPGSAVRSGLPAAVQEAGDSVRARRVSAGIDELWLWTGRLGAWHYRAGAWSRPADPRDHPHEVAYDAAGRSYLGLTGSRLRIVDGAAQREYGARDGLGVGKFTLILPGAPLLVAGEEGMQVLVGGRFRTLSVDLPGGLGPANGIAVDASGARWINAERGIFRVAAGDWARTVKDPGVALRGRLLDAADGYLGGAVSRMLSRTAVASSDGKLWFAGERGLAWIDPRKVAINPATPDVEVLGLSSGAQRYVPGAPIELEAGVENLQVDYTAPSLRMPQKVTFRYRLEGASEWEDAGTRRSAFFQRLHPGAYTFEVMAINESGVAGRVTRLLFSIAPLPTQTWWFRGACIVAVLCALILAYRLRLRQLARRIEGELLARVRERESIARSLHDTFLQGVQGMLLSMHAALGRLPAGSPARAEFERVLEGAERVLEEGRDEVQGLRRHFADTGEFQQSLLRDVELAVPGGGARLRLDAAPGAIERLPERLRRDVHAIVREAVVNALRHTAGPVEVRSDAASRELVMTVADHGRGLGEHVNGRPGHFGLQGMREAAAQIGARLRFEQGEHGARVVLAIPLAAASVAPQRSTVLARTVLPGQHRQRVVDYRHDAEHAQEGGQRDGGQVTQVLEPERAQHAADEERPQ